MPAEVPVIALEPSQEPFVPPAQDGSSDSRQARLSGFLAQREIPLEFSMKTRVGHSGQRVHFLTKHLGDTEQKRRC